MKKTRIVHLTTVHPAYDTRIYEKELSSLINAGYDCHLVCLNQKSQTAPNGLNIHSVNTWLKFRPYRMLIGTIKVVLKGLTLNGKIYHIHDPELLPATILLKFFGKKIVYDVHENYAASLMTKPYLTQNSCKTKTLAWLVGKLERFFSIFYDLIIATTPLIADLFNPKKTIIVANFPVIYFDQNINQQPRTKNLIYAGGLTKIRGVKEMVQVMGLIPEHYQCRLILAGKFESSSFEEEVRSLPDWNKISYVGWQSRDQLNKLCTESYLGLLLFHKVQNHFFCVPNKIFEYLSCGLPVIATNFDHWKDFNKDTDCISFVEPHDVQAIAKIIIQYLEENNIDHIRNDAISLVKNHFTWNSESKKLIQAYEKL